MILPPYPKPDDQNDYLAPHALILLASFQHWTGRAIINPHLPGREQARRLFYMPSVVLSHNGAPDPVFTYANQAALRLFGYAWEELIGLASRHSAEPMHQSERERLLTTVARQGYIDDYRGIRISKSGRRFLIEQAVVWNLIDEQGRYRGQAATFSDWTFLE